METTEIFRGPGPMVRAIVLTALLVAAPQGGTGAQPAQNVGEGGKCGLAYRLLEQGMAGKEHLPPAIPASRTRTEFQTSRVIGHFEFFYDTTGPDAPAMLAGGVTRIPSSYDTFVDSAGEIFNDVYRQLTEVLGYGDPLQPGQAYYQVNIFDNRYYGETVPGSRIGTSTPARYTSSMNIENDFLNFYSAGISGLRVTAAHEFFHAIQLAVYGYWSTDIYFMEISSTWMEDVIYDDVNDYYQYIRGPAPGGGFDPRGHFAHPEISFTHADGLIEYSRAIFGKFVEKRYAPGIIRTAWELIPSRPAVSALDAALSAGGSSFREAMLTWNLWNSTTGPGCDTSAYYHEGTEYPRIRTRAVAEFMPPSRVITDSIFTLGSVYQPVLVGGSPMMVIISNVRAAGPSARVVFSYEMASDGDQSYRRLSNGLFVKLIVPDPDNWSTYESAPKIIPGVVTAPNPFHPSGPGGMRFQIPATAPPSHIRLKVLSMSMEEVYAGDIVPRGDLSSSFVQVAEWDGTDKRGTPVSSGIYYYILAVDETEYTGKFAVIR